MRKPALRRKKPQANEPALAPVRPARSSETHERKSAGMTLTGFSLIWLITAGRWPWLTGALLILTSVSGYMTFRGMLLGTADGPATLIETGTFIVLAVAVTFMLHAGWSAAFRIVPAQERGKPLGYSLIILLVFCALALSVSTYSNVVAIAGPRAVLSGMRASLESFSAVLAHQGQKSGRFGPFAEEFQRAALYYRARAAAEANTGSSSGGSGAGTVTYTLTDIAGRFETLAASTKTLAGAQVQQIGAAQEALQAARRALNSQKELEERAASFKDALDRARQAIISLSDPAPAAGLYRALSAIPHEARNRPLTAKTPAGQLAQQEALERIEKDLRAGMAASLAALQAMMAESAPDLPHVPVLTPMEAVWVYKHAFIPAWAAGIGLDLLPLVILLFCLAPSLFMRREERQLHEASVLSLGTAFMVEDMLAAIAAKDKDREHLMRLRRLHRGKGLPAPDISNDNEGEE